jgi:hypothetical protein
MIPLLGWSGFRTETVDIAILCTTTIRAARRANEKQCEASPFVVIEYRYTDSHAWSALCWVMLHSERFSKLTCATARPTSLCERAANQPRSQSTQTEPDHCTHKSLSTCPHPHETQHLHPHLLCGVLIPSLGILFPPACSRNGSATKANLPGLWLALWHGAQVRCRIHSTRHEIVVDARDA